MVEKFNYKDTFVHVRSCKFRSQNHIERKTCWCCNHEFQDEEQCVILINNYKYIPNMIIHKECYNKVKPGYRENMCENIEKDYRDYEELSEIFG